MKASFFVIAGLLVIMCNLSIAKQQWTTQSTKQSIQQSTKQSIQQSTKQLTKQCHVTSVDIFTEWVTMHRPCIQHMRQLIQMSVSASVEYLAIGAHFSRDVINRPGLAKLFFDTASGEREQAIKLINYMLMRGELTSNVSTLIKVKAPVSKFWTNGAEALEHALKMETNSTIAIRKVIAVCEDDPEFNDYHLVDYLIGEFLEKQYRRQRCRSGKASTLKRMLEHDSPIGEFIFDKKFLGTCI